MELSDRVHIPPPPGRVADPDECGTTQNFFKSHVKISIQIGIENIFTFFDEKNTSFFILKA
jgi:hypothetical protein